MQRVNEKSIYKFIGRRIKEHREKATEKVTQDDLAKAIDLTRVSIANYEAGNQAISIADLYRVAAYFSVSALDFLPDMQEILIAEPEDTLASQESLTDEERQAIERIILSAGEKGAKS